MPISNARARRALKRAVQNSTPPPATSSGAWLTEAQYAAKYGISRQTLTNWRYVDRKNGRTSAPDGFPIYKKFGNCVRYFDTEGAQ